MPVLQACDTPLSEAYDLAMLDLDGVVYRGPTAVPGAVDNLNQVAADGLQVAYVTNNASRPPSAVAVHLRRLGIPVEDASVVNSAQAAAGLLAERLPGGSAVFVIGGAGLYAALADRGLRGVQRAEPQPAAVVSGYHPDLSWSTIGVGAMLVREGLLWVAANADMTLPLPGGTGPGNGVLVEVVRRFADRDPLIAGKPEAPLFQETLRRTGARRPLVVGDRLDTDIEGAVNSDLDSLLVMTGVTGAAELVAAPPGRRPSYVAADLAGLREPQPTAALDDGCSGRLGGWTGRIEDGCLELRGGGSPSDWWRLVAELGWRHLDDTGRPVAVAEGPPEGSVTS
jgi:glycerol-1-phosphatase